MKCLLTSHALLALLEIDGQGRIAGWRVLSRGYHYGAARVGDRAVVYRGGEHGDAQTAPELLMVDLRSGEIERREPLSGVGDVHQILPVPSGIWLTDTAHDRLLLHGESESREYRFSMTPRDRHHINSLHASGPHLLVMMHNRRHLESQIAVLAQQADGMSEVARLSLWDVMCHNIAIDHGRLLYLASYANQLVAVDLARDRLQQRIDLNALLDRFGERGHVKGLSLSGDQITLAVSGHAEREGRTSSRACLLQLGRGDLRLSRYIDLDPLPDRPGNINEVIVLDGEEEAARSTADIPWSALRLARAERFHFVLRRTQLMLLAPAIRWRRRHRARSAS